MKFKKIVGFGDSWMWGDELMDPQYLDHEHAHPTLHLNTPYRESHCFLGLLSKHYGVPCENFGIPGGSLQSEIWTLLWWLDHEHRPEDCLIVVGHTEGSRMTFYDPEHVSYSNDPPWNKFVHSAWVHAGADSVPRDWSDMIKRYMVLSESPALSAWNYKQALLTFDGVAARLGMPMIQFDVADPLVDYSVPTKILHGFDFCTWLRRHPEEQTLSAPMGHPNEKGHVVMAEMLQIQIDRAILAG